MAVIVFVLGTYLNPESVFNAWLPLALLANKIYLEAVLEFSAEVETADAVAAFPVILALAVMYPESFESCETFVRFPECHIFRGVFHVVPIPLRKYKSSSEDVLAFPINCQTE